MQGAFKTNKFLKTCVPTTLLLLLLLPPSADNTVSQRFRGRVWRPLKSLRWSQRLCDEAAEIKAKPQGPALEVRFSSVMWITGLSIGEGCARGRGAVSLTINPFSTSFLITHLFFFFTRPVLCDGIPAKHISRRDERRCSVISYLFASRCKRKKKTHCDNRFSLLIFRVPVPSVSQNWRISWMQEIYSTSKK